MVAPSFHVALAAFGIENAHLVHSFESSTQNDNLLVRLPSGEQFVLRRCRRNESATRLRWQAALENYLASAGFPVAAVRPTLAGDSVAEADDERWMLHDFVDGEHYDFTRTEQAESAGRLLAAFHLLTTDFPAEGATHVLELRHRRFFFEAAAEFRALRARFRSAELLASLRAAEAWVDGLLHAWPLTRFDALSNGWIHSDYHGRNLLFDEGDVAALLDFDMVERAPFVLDLIRALVAFGREGRDSNVIRVDVARRLLAAYETVRPVTDEERLAIVQLAGIFELPRDHFYDWHPHDRLDPMSAARGRLARWRAHREQAEVLAAVVGAPIGGGS